MISETETRHLTSCITEVMNKLKTRRPLGRLYIFEYPTKSLTVKEVDRQCTRLQMQKGVSLDMCVTDYAGIMKPGRFYKDNVLKEEAGIFEDLRGLAGRQSIPHLTGNQNNRAASGKALTKGSDTGGTWEKIQIVDGNNSTGINPDLGYVILTEGAFHVWGWERNGIGNALGTFGKKISDEQMDLLLDVRPRSGCSSLPGTVTPGGRKPSSARSTGIFLRCGKLSISSGRSDFISFSCTRLHGRHFTRFSLTAIIVQHVVCISKFRVVIQRFPKRFACIKGVALI